MSRPPASLALVTRKVIAVAPSSHWRTDWPLVELELDEALDARRKWMAVRSPGTDVVWGSKGKLFLGEIVCSLLPRAFRRHL